jgi:glycosyltransferase involved in cell wall biosynthesis
VVIPTRDRPELLALTLRSVLWQQDIELEALVVDDGSDPGTQAVVDDLHDVRVRLIRNAGPRGVSGARNIGIAAARGDWIAFLDDDDLWSPDKLRAQLAAGNEARAGWVYAGDVSVDEGLRVRSGSRPSLPEAVVAGLQTHNAVPAGASNVIVRRDVLDSVGRFDPGLGTSEDWDLWLRLAATTMPACVPRPLVALREHARMASRNVDRMLADIEIIAERHRIRVDRARHRRWAAWLCLEDGNRGGALRHYMRAAATGDIMSLGRAALTLVSPQVARRRPASADDWTSEAQKWLDDLLVAPAVPSALHTGTHTESARSRTVQ